MSRVHLFEISDLPWCPATLRQGGTAYLTRFAQLTGMLGGVKPHLIALVEAAEGKPIVDLCTGSGGPAGLMIDALCDEGHLVDVIGTDLRPHDEALRLVALQHPGRFTWRPDAVDATAVPADLSGPRTLFNGFHHFPPALARAILADAVACGAPIGVFEFVGRQPYAVAGMLGVPLSVMALVPFLRPFRSSWLPLTYLVPLLPALVFWDGVVSCLRVYSPQELRSMVEGLDSFDWDIGTFPLPFPGYGTYLVGTPRA